LRKFIKKTILFLLLLVIINLTFHCFLTKEVVFNKYIYNGQNLEKYNVFILSDSHGEALKNLTNQFNIFNFSYVGDNYQDMYYKLLYLSSHIDSNDVILITVNHHTLSKYRDVSNNTIRNLMYVNNIENVFDDDLNTEFHKSKLFKKVPLLVGNYGSFYFDYIKNHLKDGFFDDLSFANVPAIKQKKQIESRFNQQFGNDDNSEKGLFFLNKIIEISKKYKFQLKGIKYPVSNLYYNKIKDFDMNAEMVLTLNNIETIDFQKKYFFSDDMFKDQDHLNKKGAQVLLEKLKVILN
jgi:hypothetical protein|tara:strand:+ start:143 stop:1024 length:882 start_codon:yes stop_codon:yes gene_type:complete